MDARTVDNLAAVDSPVETTELNQRWKEIVEPGIYLSRRQMEVISRAEVSTK